MLVSILSINAQWRYIEVILPKGPYPPCLRMADKSILTGYPRYLSAWRAQCNSRSFLRCDNCRCPHVPGRRHGILGTSLLNTLRPKQNGRHFPDDIFKCIFLDGNVWISIKISLKFVIGRPNNNFPALVQIMAWRRPGHKPLSELMMVSLLTHICVTRPQWVKDIFSKSSLANLVKYCWRKKMNGRLNTRTVTGIQTQITKFTGPTWVPPGSCRTLMGLMLAPWTLLSGEWLLKTVFSLQRLNILL